MPEIIIITICSVFVYGAFTEPSRSCDRIAKEHNIITSWEGECYTTLPNGKTVKAREYVDYLSVKSKLGNKND